MDPYQCVMRHSTPSGGVPQLHQVECASFLGSFPLEYYHGGSILPAAVQARMMVSWRFSAPVDRTRTSRQPFL